MHRAVRVPIVVALAAALAACASRASSSDATPRPSLAGSWLLNAEESEDPAAQMAEAGGAGVGRTAGGGRGGMGGGGGGGRGGGRGGMGGGGGGGDPAAMQQRAAKMRAVIQSLTEGRSRIALKQSDSTVVLTYDEGTRIESLTDGKEREMSVGGLGDIKLKAEWNDGQLIVERKLEGGLKVREEFTRGPDSPRLIVVTSISGLPRDLKFRSVYDRSTD